MKAKLKDLFKFRRQVFAYPYMLFLLIFVIVPLVLVLVNAFISDLTGEFTFQNFADFFTDGASIQVLGNSIVIGVLTTIICLLLAYPVAYILAKHKAGKLLVILFVLPMWVNFLLRTLAMKAIFENFLNIVLANNYAAVLFGMVYNYLPFMILPLHTTIDSIDKSYIEAAQDLGCDGIRTFLTVTLPLSLPGIISGITMVFIPTISTFAISELLSNRTILLFGDSINYKFTSSIYGVGSVMSLVMLAFVIIANVIMNRFTKDQQGVKHIW